MPSTAEKQRRILPFFQFTSLSTKDKFGILVQRDPRLAGLGVLGRGVLFSCFHEEHLKEATQLYEVLIECESFEEFLDLCHQAREYVNEGLYVYAVSVAILHRQDCRGVSLPPVQEVFPDKFVPAETLFKAFKEVRLHAEDEEIIVDIEKTGNVKDPEYNLAYYREDIGVNAHHWHWHLVYPATWRPEVVHRIKDRKGELFFYMHQQMCARYDCERLSVGLQRMIPFQNLDDELEGYSPHLSSLVSGLSYGSRPAGMHLRDINDCSVQDMERWRERILDAIHTGLVTDSHGKEIKLTEENGLNILGALIESSHDSVNKPFYGTLHNWGHVMIARIHDADGRYRTNPGVMDDTSTSLRDPIFYRYHRWMDNIFQEYKHRLPSYTHQQLDFPGVRISRVTVRSKVPNLIHTYSKDSLLELSHGINLKGHIQVKYEHLDHEPYNYEIEVDNRTGEARETCVRIFLAPKYDELGNRLILEEQRRLYIELDKFHRRLEPGKNVLVRASGDSSVTLSKVPTFEELESGNANVNPNEYCSCGWPEHMLVPRGKERGMDFYLFVMLTDYEEDKVQGAGEQTICSDAVSYCGAKDQKYPDKKAMGYPFDRPIQVRTPSQFKTPNMAFQEIIIQYEGHKH